MKNIKDIIIVSDLDGTMIPHGKNISKKNIEAIKKFRKSGGIFTVATGRSPASATPFLKPLEVDSFFISSNGAVIHDFKTKRDVYTRLLPVGYEELLYLLLNQFPNVGLIVYGSGNKFFIPRHNPYVEYIIKLELSGLDANEDYLLNSMPLECYKVLFVGEDKEILDMAEFCTSMENNIDVDFIRSGNFTFEILPKGVSKGTALKHLVELYDKKIENTYAIGDYCNDIEMIKLAGTGAAVANALDEVKAAADIVVKSCEEDGIADLIEHILENAV